MKNLTKTNPFAVALITGVGFGAAIGFLNNNLMLWVSLGVILGLAYGRVLSQRARVPVQIATPARRK